MKGRSSNSKAALSQELVSQINLGKESFLRLIELKWCSSINSLPRDRVSFTKGQQLTKRGFECALGSRRQRRHDPFLRHGSNRNT
jgi:hypothetical protein